MCQVSLIAAVEDDGGETDEEPGKEWKQEIADEKQRIREVDILCFGSRACVAVISNISCGHRKC